MVFAASLPPGKVVKRKGMSVKKEPIDQTRLRSVPREGFSWIDRRFVREGFIGELSGEAILLYLFLVAVSDSQGLSFYADPTVSRILRLDQEQLTQARARLLEAKLILYRYPLYQVLPIPERPKPSTSVSLPLRVGKQARGGDPISLSDLLKLARAKLRNLDNPDSVKEAK